MIQHAWHFWYAVVSVLKCYAVAWSLRASHLNWALAGKGEQVSPRLIGIQNGIIVFVFWLCVGLLLVSDCVLLSHFLQHIYSQLL
ncbi:hypothetical protein BOO93_20675 [Vibrio navarrensis]|nr:hypothetical protein [Vibrio navarrensis]